MLKKFLYVSFFACVLAGINTIVSAQEMFIRSEVLPVTNYIFHSPEGDMYVKNSVTDKPAEVKSQKNTDTKEVPSEQKVSTEESIEEMVNENPDSEENK